MGLIEPRAKAGGIPIQTKHRSGFSSCSDRETVWPCVCLFTITIRCTAVALHCFFPHCTQSWQFTFASLRLLTALGCTVYSFCLRNHLEMTSFRNQIFGVRNNLAERWSLATPIHVWVELLRHRHCRVAKHINAWDLTIGRHVTLATFTRGLGSEAYHNIHLRSRHRSKT